jgi:hypothetical protein
MMSTWIRELADERAAALCMMRHHTLVDLTA